MTPTQTRTLAALLSVDLANVDTDRLIELCILHRANPKAHDAFPAALKAELERRFDDAAIRADDTSFAVLERFNNEFQSALPYFAIKLREMAATVNRDIWFTDNEAVFKSGLNDPDIAAWIVQNLDILTKILHNDVALPWVAQSSTASKAILTRAESLALWKDTPKLWQVWPHHAAGMGVISTSGELTQYVIDTPAALSAITVSPTAMNAIIASPTAMNAVAASSTAMNAVAANEPALRAIVNHKAARDALIANNDKLQAVRETMYNTVKNVWTKVRSVDLREGNVGVRYHSNNSQLANPENALIFVCLGNASGYSGGRHQLEHADGTIAAAGGTRNAPTSIVTVDGVSFAGAKIKQTANYGHSYAEVYAPH